ncbi:MAG: hypothetical protein ABEJ05_01115 [Haloglomus sp.]
MRRRALLRAAALAGVAGIAGCTGGRPSDGESGGGGGPSPTSTPTSTPTDSPTRPLADGIERQSFEVTDRGCGQGRNDVAIDFDESTVTLDGVIDGSNGCYTAEQASLDYDPEADRLHVNVRAYEPADADVCAQCIVDIEYAARYVFEGEAPGEVTVAHDGRDIATAAHGSAGASARQTSTGSR